MMSFTPTTYEAALNPSSCPPSSSRLIFAACGFGVFAWGDRACATADLLGDCGPPVEPSCITSSASADGAPAPAPAAPSCCTGAGAGAAGAAAVAASVASSGAEGSGVEVSVSGAAA